MSFDSDVIRPNSGRDMPTDDDEEEVLLQSEPAMAQSPTPIERIELRGAAGELTLTYA